MKRGELASKIWRTVVFSGAMLGAPLAAADSPPAKQVVAPDDKLQTELVELDKQLAAATTAAKSSKDAVASRASLDALQRERALLVERIKVAATERELNDLDAKVKAALTAVASARSDAERGVAKQRLEAIQKTRAVVVERISASLVLRDVARLERELTEFHAKLDAAVDAVVAAQDDADRQAAKARLVALQKTRAELEAKLAAVKARATAAKRPRAPEQDRPIGRGFILS